MNQEALVSVIIPVYQAEKYLERGILSVLKQTYRSIELILVDDGSTDKSAGICDAYAEKYSEISVYHRKHQGVSAARNYGISKANGVYVQFMDADDEMLPGMLEQLVATIQEKNAFMAVCGYVVMDKNFSKQEVYGQWRHLEHCLGAHHIYEIVQSDLLSVTWNKLYIRKRIADLYDESAVICEDSMFCVRYFMRNPKVAVCSQILYRYYAGKSELCKPRVYRYRDIEKYFRVNCKLVSYIPNSEKRKVARYHAARVFYYGVYTYIFEKLPQTDIGLKEKRALLREILQNKTYISTVSKLRRLYWKEECYRVASVLQSDKVLYAMIWCRNIILHKGK